MIQKQPRHFPCRGCFPIVGDGSPVPPPFRVCAFHYDQKPTLTCYTQPLHDFPFRDGKSVPYYTEYVAAPARVINPRLPAMYSPLQMDFTQKDIH